MWKKEKKKRWPPPAILTDNIPPLDLDLNFPSGSCLMLLGYWPTWTLQKDFHFYQTEDGFWPDFEYNNSQQLHQSYSFLSANVPGPVICALYASIDPCNGLVPDVSRPLPEAMLFGINEVQGHSSRVNFTVNTPNINHWNHCWNAYHLFQFTNIM